MTSPLKSLFKVHMLSEQSSGWVVTLLPLEPLPISGKLKLECGPTKPDYLLNQEFEITIKAKGTP